MKFDRSKPLSDEIKRQMIHTYKTENLSGQEVAELYGVSESVFWKYWSREKNGYGKNTKRTHQNHTDYKLLQEKIKNTKLANNRDHEMYKDVAPIQKNNNNNEMYNRSTTANNNNEMYNRTTIANNNNRPIISNNNESHKYTVTNNNKVPANNNAIHSNEIEQINIKKNKPFERAFDVMGGYVKNGRHKVVAIPE